MFTATDGSRHRTTSRPWVILLESRTHALASEPRDSGARVAGRCVPETSNARRFSEPTNQRLTLIRFADAALPWCGAGGKNRRTPDPFAEAEQSIDFLKHTRASMEQQIAGGPQRGRAGIPSFLTHMNQSANGFDTAASQRVSTCCPRRAAHCRLEFITERRAISLDPNCGWARGKAECITSRTLSRSGQAERMLGQQIVIAYAHFVVGRESES